MVRAVKKLYTHTYATTLYMDRCTKKYKNQVFRQSENKIWVSHQYLQGSSSIIFT